MNGHHDPSLVDLGVQPLRFLNAFWNVWRELTVRVDGALSQDHALDLRAFIALSYVQAAPVSPGELSRLMGVPKYEITRTLDRLGKLNAITRTTNAQNARRQDLRATEQGHTLWTAALVTVQRVAGTPLATLGSDVEPLTASLERLAHYTREHT